MCFLEDKKTPNPSAEIVRWKFLGLNDIWLNCTDFTKLHQGNEDRFPCRNCIPFLGDGVFEFIHTLLLDTNWQENIQSKPCALLEGKTQWLNLS